MSTLPGPAIHASKLRYVGFQTPDLDRMVDYYTTALTFEAMDVSPSDAYLRTGPEHHCISLTEGPARARTLVGFEIVEDLGFAEARLREAGYEVQRRSDPGPGTADVLVIAEPDTGVPLHLIEREGPGEVDSLPPLRPTKLGHVASFASSIEPLQTFYEQALGFRWSDTVGDFFVFLRCGPEHHTVNVMASAKYQGMHHIAYEMRDPAHLITMLDHLSRCGHRLIWGPGRHGPGHNMFSYHRDPDGNVIELFTQLDVIYDEAAGHWEPRPWHETYPMGPRHWDGERRTGGNLWGPSNKELLDR